MELLKIIQVNTITLVLIAFVFCFGSCQNIAPSVQSSTVAVCGIIDKPDPKPLEDTSFASGDWPWLATIYRKERQDLKRSCLGTLINARAVLTTAHCLFKFMTPLTPDQILVKLGQTNLSSLNDLNVVSSSVNKLIVHPKFQPPLGGADIGIIELQNDIEFSDFIKPPCLWTGDSKSAEGSFGFIARWGPDLGYRTSARLVSDETCLRSKDIFLTLTSETTICAGDKNGLGPCSGDSGSGLLLKQNGRWAVRAVVATSLVTADGKCDLNEYLVYTDVSKVYTWIQSNLPKSIWETDEILDAALEVCGRNTRSDPEPLKETSLSPGDWPWLATLYRRTARSLRYLCIGTLISSRAVVTAAHCLHRLDEPLIVTDLVVQLGQSNIRDWNENSVISPAIKYYDIHPSFTPPWSSMGDIALIVFRVEIAFTNQIQPACLWSGNIDFSEGEYGYVARWGTNDARRTSAKIVNVATCLRSSYGFAHLTSNTTLCAGDKNGFGPCSGDSGSGLLVTRGDQWMLRGLVASALTSLEGICDLNQYIVYTDVSRTIDWIKSAHLNIKKLDSSYLSLHSSQSDGICGQVDSYFNLRPLAFGGVEIQRGIWPWLVAIYRVRRDITNFQCGGTLVSKTVIISAAHCFYDREGQLNSNNIIVYLGLHELSKRNESGVISPSVKDIIIHSGFNLGRQVKDSDIAIITLNQPISYTDFIRPACVWSTPETSQDQIGYVVGWGQYEAAELSERPRQVFARIVGTEECLRSNEVFAQITSNRTFCAGNRDNTGPCKGDSGSGLLIEHNGKWFLRGIVSTSLSHPLSLICNLREFVVYSDVGKFRDWINQVVP